MGGADLQVLALNRDAMGQMTAPVHLKVISGATHLFEVPGTLAQAATLATDWFSRYLLPGDGKERAPEAWL